nr:MAG TPA: hypothetical protein [Caudoviricetes sp.]
MTTYSLIRCHQSAQVRKQTFSQRRYDKVAWKMEFFFFESFSFFRKNRKIFAFIKNSRKAIL